MARKTIAQRIALDGGKEILEQLKGLGKEGEKAFDQIAKAAEKAGSPGAKLGKSLQDLRGQLDKLGKAGAKLRGDLQNLGSSLGTVAARSGLAVAAVGALAAGVVAFARAGTEAADAAVKQAQAIGLPVDAYGRLAFAAEQAGVSQEQLGTGVNRLNRLMIEASEGSKSAAEAFERIGIETQTTFGKLRPTEEILGELADKFQKMPDGAAKSALAIELFGKAGAGLIPLLNGGSAGLKELGLQAEALGIVFTKEQATIAEAMNDALSALNKARLGTQSQLALLFAPTITQAAQALTDFITGNRVALQDLAERGLAYVIPLVKDFINAITGNDVDVQNLWILQARDAVISFGEAVFAAITGIIIPAFTLLTEAAGIVATAINGIFGTNFTGQQVLVAAAVAQFLGLFTVLGAGIAVLTSTVGVLVAGIGLIGPALAVAGAAFTALGPILAAVGTALLGLVGWPALIIAGIVAAAAAIYVFWDEIVAGAKKAVSLAIDAFKGAGKLIGDAFGLAADGAKFAWDKMVAGAKFAWSALSDGFRAVIDFIISGFNRLSSVVTTTLARIRSAIASIKAALKSATSNGEGRGVNYGTTANFAQGGRVRGPGTATSDSILARLSNGEFVNRTASVRYYGTQLFDALNNLRIPRDKLAAALRLVKSGNVKDRDPAFASGGFVSAGRSLRSVASTGAAGFRKTRDEFPAFAVGGLVKIARDLPRFATGGLATGNGIDFSALPAALLDSLTAGMGQMQPAFAGGPVAPAKSGRPLSLTIDGQTFQGLTATDDAAEQLSRYAANRAMRSAGRSPGWKV